MFRYLLFISCQLFFLSSFSQSVPITGKVMDQNYFPIPFAHITDLNLDSKTVADSAGNFIIHLNRSEISLKASAVGFQNQIIKITSKSFNNPVVFKLKENNDFLNEMVVSGTLQLIKKKDSPIPIAVYKSQYLNAVPSSSLVDATNQIAGLRPQINCSVCNSGDIHINGMEGAYSMVVIDGMPIMGGLSTVYGLQGIPTSLINQVEIIKGPASTLYGSEAMAGLINVVTKSVECIPKIMLDFNVSSWGEVQNSLTFKLIDKKRWKSFTALDIFLYNNPIDNNEDNFTDLTLKNPDLKWQSSFSWHDEKSWYGT